MDFGPLEEMQKQYGTFNDPAPLPGPEITNPSVVYVPNKSTKRSGDMSGQLKNLEEL